MEFIKDMFEDAPIISSCFALLIILLILLIVDVAASKPRQFIGVVIDKHYKAERTFSGTGTTINSDGKVGIISTTERDPEEFLIMVKSENHIQTVKSSPEIYYTKSKGNQIVCVRYEGFFSGAVWSVRGIE